MKAFGFLSFGHYAFGGQRGPSAEKIAKIHWQPNTEGSVTGYEIV